VLDSCLIIKQTADSEGEVYLEPVNLVFEAVKKRRRPPTPDVNFDQPEQKRARGESGTDVNVDGPTTMGGENPTPPGGVGQATASGESDAEMEADGLETKDKTTHNKNSKPSGGVDDVADGGGSDLSEVPSSEEDAELSTDDDSEPLCVNKSEKVGEGEELEEEQPRRSTRVVNQENLSVPTIPAGIPPKRRRKLRRLKRKATKEDDSLDNGEEGDDGDDFEERLINPLECVNQKKLLEVLDEVWEEAKTQLEPEASAHPPPCSP
jgi:hypothetical protein